MALLRALECSPPTLDLKTSLYPWLFGTGGHTLPCQHGDTQLSTQKSSSPFQLTGDPGIC